MGTRARHALSLLLPHLRLRPGGVALGVGAVLLAVRAVGAQVPPPADTVAAARDTVGAVRPDTIPPAPGDTVPADTLKPVVVVAPFRAGEAPRWSAGVWEWDRDALLRSSALSLNELLAQIPGVTPVRSGFLGQPEAAARPGGTGGFTEIYLDGFALDPLDASTYDLSRLELVHLSRVRVERRGGGLRVELETIAPTDHRPFSMVEAGTGDYGARMVRGTFMTPDFLVGPLALGIERLEGNGLFNTQPANTFTGWLKWARGVGPTTLQMELRRNSVEWNTPEKVGLKGFRQDWVVRARTRLASPLTAEAFLGGSALEDQYADSTSEARGLQGGLRTAYQGERFWTAATLRGRDQDFLPRLEADAAAGVQLPGAIHLSGDITHADWREGRQGSSWGVRAELAPLTLIRPFVEYSSGTRGIPGLRDDDGRAILTERAALRAGGELSWRGARLGAAWNRIEADAIADFGLPFDRTGALHAGGMQQGLELNGRIPLLWEPLWVEGWYTRWTGANPWIYLPGQSWRTALVYHDTPMASGNLEISARLELSHRDWMVVPTLTGGADGEAGIIGTSTVPGLTSLDFYLQIRILDVRAFVRWNNIAHQLGQHDLPGRYFPGQRTFYGIKWQFWN
jgi:hypothetical protein